MINRAYETAKRSAPAPAAQQRRELHQPPAGRGPIVADLGLDEISLAAALLHDAVEDTEITLADVEAGVRRRGGADRRRRHQARAPAVRLQGGAAGRHDAQDAGGDGHATCACSSSSWPTGCTTCAPSPRCRPRSSSASPTRRSTSTRRWPTAWACRSCKQQLEDLSFAVALPEALRRARPPGRHPLARARGVPGQGDRRGPGPAAAS